jgi:multiple sugar transport system permease protein
MAVPTTTSGRPATGGARAITRRGGRTLQQQRARMFYILILPWLTGFVLFVLGPMLFSLWLSFHRWNLLNLPVAIGFDNYVHMAHDALFWQSLKVTTVYAFVSVPLGLAFALLLAILLNQRVRGLAIFRTIFYLPSVASGVAVAVLFLWIFNPQFGLINNLLSYLGIPGPAWLASADWALPTLIIMSLWSTGGTMIIFLAGLQNVPTELLEAASLDGAGNWKRFRYVTLPLLTPTILFNLVLLIINQFQTFTQAYTMTNGGPLYSTLFYVYYLYQNAFAFLNMGYAAALAWVLFTIVLVLTVIVLRTSNRWVFYQGGG